MKGFSRTNLFYIRKWRLFYNELEKVPQLVGQIPWGHNREIVTKCLSIDEALFYVKETIQNNWSRTMLLHQIESDLYHRQVKAIHNFNDTLPRPRQTLLVKS